MTLYRRWGGSSTGAAFSPERWSVAPRPGLDGECRPRHPAVKRRRRSPAATVTVTVTAQPDQAMAVLLPSLQGPDCQERPAPVSADAQRGEF